MPGGWPGCQGNGSRRSWRKSSSHLTRSGRGSCSAGDCCPTCLRELPPQPIPRWRGFCAATGFPIECLPVERALRRGVRHPEEEVLRRLALSGGELAALGLKGREIGAAQRKLALHVLEHPEDNRCDKLMELLKLD